MADAWTRRSGESIPAFDAFQLYLQHGSIDAAWRATEQGQTSHAKRAPGQWAIWSSRYEWVKRAQAYQDHLAEQDRQKWERRRAELLERDWAQADRMRQIVDDAQLLADQFLESKTTTIRGTPTILDTEGNVIQQGTPTRQIITTSLGIVAVSKVLTDASKLQRLATDEPTEHIQLTGAALDAFIAGQLARLRDGGEASTGETFEPNAAETDAGADADDPGL